MAIPQEQKQELKRLWDLEGYDTRVEFVYSIFEEDEFTQNVILDGLGILLDMLGKVSAVKWKEIKPKSKHFVLMKALVEESDQIICKDWDFCQKKETLEDEGIGLALTIIEGATTGGFPVMALILYIVKDHLLDRFCSCSAANR